MMAIFFVCSFYRMFFNYVKNRGQWIKHNSLYIKIKIQPKLSQVLQKSSQQFDEH